MWELQLFYHKLPRQVASQTKSTPLCECVSESANTVEACTMLRAATNKTEPHTLSYKIASKIVTVRSWSAMYSEGSENMAFYGHKGIFNDLGEDLVSRAPCTICKHLIGHLIGRLKPEILSKFFLLFWSVHISHQFWVPYRQNWITKFLSWRISRATIQEKQMVWTCVKSTDLKSFGFYHLVYFF